ncbi:MAG TPA: hypothetical protein VJP89_10960 [Pyrinomonadaceae bacterium]|nr:hypothetical protein [Pyrinomonadaceae bacterium]
MKRVLMASRPFGIFACVLLTLFLHTSSNAVTPTKPSSNVIRIWIVGSPHTNALPPAVVPPELRKRAEGLGYTIEIEVFRPGGFATLFHQALQSHTEPEILTFDNYGVISGMKTVNTWVDGIDWDRRTASSLALVHETMTSLQPRGWVMLVPSAVNYGAARALSMRPAECDARSGRATDSSAIEPILRDAQEAAVRATRAYFDCDRPTLAAISDESRLGQQCLLPQSDTKTETMKACSVSGNHKLAFVSLAGSFSAKTRDPRTIYPSMQGMNLGQRSILAVLTNQSGTWRLLAITHDPANTVARTPVTTNTLVNSLDDGPPAGVTTLPARLLTPNGVFPVSPKADPFGNFIWEPSQSSDVIGQVVEFMWAEDTDSGLTRLFFLPASENKLSTRYLMSGVRTAWRVWSVTKSGAVVFSERHSYTHCPCPTFCFR